MTNHTDPLATSHLPAMNGASVVYSRALRILEQINEREYARQRAAAKRPLKSYRPPYDADVLITAMNRGDEETLKSMIHQHRHLIGL